MTLITISYIAPSSMSVSRKKKKETSKYTIDVCDIKGVGLFFFLYLNNIK